MSLIEMMVASTIGIIALGALGSLSFYTARAFASLNNYGDMDQESRVALDRMTREIRQANTLETFSSTNLTFNKFPLEPLEYQYIAEAEELRQIKGSEVSVLLTGCKGVKFEVFQRNTVAGTFDQFPAISGTNQAKVVQVSWTCSRSLLGTEQNIVNVESAKIVIRK